ncbi:MAG: glutamate synthase [Omnitrophica WOR_2 bacterium GWF2_43_52]|nr:MAG: glutamate synthase [Omnitrophica WOR_2 bacterium GWA2_44_7]OGX15996.1 MAG: glutamate synthase [Omnitrophica WOR_2 bacterium GWC2_44_8]OGX20756.1 MAG: glutamate synthase [Omnitrophica WOR_2 bacterium GWF2_43_52]HAH19779.1 glutamate synthase [Candidatus Omnitrophota bacterium]HBG63404.1 glutamate synthase [Candidatus Omnitrophota bacterium]
MAVDIKGFLKVKRGHAEYRPVCERVKDYKEVIVLRSASQSEEQGLRCMDCGTPFCHFGCPVGNYIPEWNELVASGKWQKAFELLNATNTMPEITGRLCPALCEYACVLGINDDPVTIRENELAIIETAFKEGFIKPQPPKKLTGKKVAVVGSGPAGLSTASQLNKAGHTVVVFEKYTHAGGILRYGIPDFKLEKRVIDRRVAIWKKEGIKFKTNINVGIDYPASKLLKEFDAACLAGGSRVARDLKIEGRELAGIHFAMDYLIQSNQRASEEKPNPHWKNSNAGLEVGQLIDAKGKRVLVIGGGDTGADCVGTANRQGASCVVQIEVMPKPPECRTEDMPWPRYPMLLKTSSSHEEGGERQWAVLTKKFIGENGKVTKVSCVRAEFPGKDAKGCPVMREVAGSEFEIEADLVILAIGFVHPEHEGLLKGLKIELDSRGNVKTDENYMTSKKGVFSAGDMRRGQSLIVWAIHEGRHAARAIDAYLMGKSSLPIL